MPKTRKSVIAAIKIALLLVVLWFVGTALVDAIRTVNWQRLRFSPAWIVLGVGLTACGYAAGAMACHQVYNGLNCALNFRQSYALFNIPMLGAFIPGRVFSLAGHTAIAKAFGVPLRV
ncbi:unnamed protein product, partial [marine sediment metagenome]